MMIDKGLPMPYLTLATFQAHLFNCFAVVKDDLPSMVKPATAFEGIPQKFEYVIHAGSIA
jgi:hypothetical protein